MSVKPPPNDSAQADIPATLADAHEVVRQQQPSKDAAASVWVDFHRHSAEVYSRVSAVDTRHRYEALACAGLEIRKARDIEHRLHPEDDS